MVSWREGVGHVVGSVGRSKNRLRAPEGQGLPEVDSGHNCTFQAKHLITVFIFLIVQAPQEKQQFPTHNFFFFCLRKRTSVQLFQLSNFWCCPGSSYLYFSLPFSFDIKQLFLKRFYLFSSIFLPGRNKNTLCLEQCFPNVSVHRVRLEAKKGIPGLHPRDSHSFGLGWGPWNLFLYQVPR